MNEAEKKVRDRILKNIEALDTAGAFEHIPAMCKAYRDFAKGCEKFHACETFSNIFPADQFATIGTITPQNDN